MAYQPTQGLFVNGRVADADEVLNEFGAISSAISEVANDVEGKTLEATKESKAYTDQKFNELTIDGGTF